MSTTYTTLEDSLLNILTSLEAEKDPVERLRAIRRLETTAVKAFRRIKREAAYDARMTRSSGEIADAVGMDRKDLDYLIRVYLVDNPYAPKPPHRTRHTIDHFVDLSGE
jgi:hypothetical protein